MNKKVVFLPYDFDTAIGINNEGALVLDYHYEDTDQIGGADVFNGQDSVLWNNLRECFPDELKDMFKQLRSSGALSYAKVEKAFEDHQSKWPEAIFNEDAFFKYIQPLIDDNDESYLSMLQGSKTEQRKWWLYNRFRYLDSKYNAGDSLSDYVQLRAYSKANITITPYADIYTGIKWGSYLDIQRAQRNVAKTMTCPMDRLNDTEIYIYSASQLSSLGDLSGLKVGFGDFHNATKLQELILGSTESGYTNSNLYSLNVGNLKLLRKIDVRNCSGLGTFDVQKTVDLSGCSGVEEVYFDGTQILGVDLPNGGFLKKLHLPGTITNLTVRNQKGITEFVCPDLSHVTTLNLENTANGLNIPNIVDSLPYVEAVADGTENPSSLKWFEASDNSYVKSADTTVDANKTYYTRATRVRLFNYRWDFQTVAAVHAFLDKFDGMTGMDQNGDNTAIPQIYATVHLPQATGDEIDAIQARYPDVTVDADVATYYLRYYNEDGTELLHTETVQKNQNGTWSTQPAKAATAQYVYTFAGWNTIRNSTTADPDALANITSNRNVYAAYSSTVQTYTVTFQKASIDGGGTLQTLTNVPYGTTPAYTGSTPTSTNNDGGIYTFDGWSPALGPITGNTTYTAVFHDSSLLVTFMNGSTTLSTAHVASGGTATYSGATPTKAQDAQYTYSFAGWSAEDDGTVDSGVLNNITANKTVYAVFTGTLRTYTITFVRDSADGGGVLQTISVAYGTVPAYSGSTPTTTKTGDWNFNGWTPALAAVTGAQTYTAVFADVSSVVMKYLKRTLTEYTSDTDATKVAMYAFYNITTLTSVETYATTIEQNAFYGCSNLEVLDLKATSGVVSLNTTGLPAQKLNSIFIRSSDTATLTGSLPTQFTSGKGAIYVPAAKVDAYKAASGWSTYASHIFSIDEYPVTNFDTIKDSWTEIAAKIQAGTDNYSVGDFKTVDLGTEGQIRMQIAAISADELSSGGSYAKYTWVAMDLLNTSHRMNPARSGTTEGTGAIGGWGKSEMRAYLSTTIWALIPAELQAVIKEVKKYSCICDTSATKVSDDVSNDKLWILSEHEVFNNTTYETTGPSYTGIFTNATSRIRKKSGASSAIDWWERSAYSISNIRYVSNTGYVTENVADYSCGVLLGFCT